jgi:hypothetical protein
LTSLAIRAVPRNPNPMKCLVIAVSIGTVTKSAYVIPQHHGSRTPRYIRQSVSLFTDHVDTVHEVMVSGQHYLPCQSIVMMTIKMINVQSLNIQV